MTKLLDLAFAKARQLPDEDQDALGAVLLSMADEGVGAIGQLDEETRLAIREGLEQARRGEFVADEEIELMTSARYSTISNSAARRAPGT